MKPKYLEFSGINSFARKAEIDFEKLLSGGIFGIFGDTGSGKTTILDSMIFALYGRIDRIKGGVGNEIINYNCDRAYVLFDFETETPQGRKVYRVEREIKRKNSAQSLTLSEVNGEQIKPVSDGVKNTNAKIQEIVGLSFEDFKKCIALPQGEFAQFVKAERSERLKLISRLFGLEKYGDLLNARIKERYSEVRSSFDTKEGELRAYGDLDGADLVAMQEECARLKAQKAQLDEEYNRFAADFEKFKDEYTRGRSLKEYKNALQVLQAREKEIGELRRLVGLALKAREICTLQRSGEQRKVKSAALERSRAAALAKKAASEAELARLREENEKANYAARAEEISAKLAALAYIKQDAESLRKKGEERERLKKEYQALQAAITKASGEAEECARREQAAQKSLAALGNADLSEFFAENFESALLGAEFRRQGEYAAAKREELHGNFSSGGELFRWADGVLSEQEARANALLATNKSNDAEKLLENFRREQKERNELNAVLTKLAAERTRAESAVREYEAKKAQISEDGVRIKGEIDAVRERMRTALGDAETDWTAAERALTKQREEIANRRADSEKRIQSAADRIRACELEAGKAEAALAQLQAEAEKEEQKTAALLDESGFQSTDDAEEIVRALERAGDAEKRISEYDGALISLRAKIQMLGAGGEPRDISDEEFAAQSEKMSALAAKKQDVNGALAVYEQRLADTQKRLEQKKRIEKERDVYKQKLDLLAKLQELTRGNKFMEYVASEYLCDISAAATATLLKLTGGRYFIKYEQGFFVGDNLCGGELRSVNTLSGGETFLVSLSLALALSSAIYAKSLKPIEFFFLDEGFGTLDEKLIDTVMDSLEKLKNSRFSIGLISHVEELKHRIGTKITVTGAAESGSSQIQINY